MFICVRTQEYETNRKGNSICIEPWTSSLSYSYQCSRAHFLGVDISRHVFTEVGTFYNMPDQSQEKGTSIKKYKNELNEPYATKNKQVTPSSYTSAESEYMENKNNGNPRIMGESDVRHLIGYCNVENVLTSKNGINTK
jgi:hypothetical protein